MDYLGDYNKEIFKLLPLIEEFFLDLVNNNYSEKTLLNYQRDIFIFSSFLFVNKIKFDDLTKIDIIKYKDYLRSGKYLKNIQKLSSKTQSNTKRTDSDTKVVENVDVTEENKKSSPKGPRRLSMYSGRLGSRSVNRMLSALRSYFRFLNEADYKTPVSADSIKLIKTEKKVSSVADLEQLIQLLEAPEEFEKKRKIRFRNRAILELLFATGMRISEVVNLNREDLNLDQSKTSIKDDRIFITGKGKKQRFVYITDRAKFYLERYLQTRDEDYPALFIPYRGRRSSSGNLDGIRVSTNYIQAKIKEYRVLKGINVPTSPHSFRHGFATYLAENGANPAAIQHLLGHESLQTTSRYVHSSDRFAKKSHEKFHPLKKVDKK